MSAAHIRAERGGSGNLVGEYVGIDARMGTVYISLVGTKYDDGDPSDPALDETAIFFTRVTFAE